MKRGLPLFVLLASALTFLASLLLPWRESTAPRGPNRPCARPCSDGHRLTLALLALPTLASLELIRFRNNSDVIWGAVILVGLSLLLTLFGWTEENRRLESFRVPESWRVDRLPEAES